MPVLSGKEAFFVEPGVEASGAEAVVEVADGGISPLLVNTQHWTGDR